MHQILRNLSDKLYDGLLHPGQWVDALEQLCQSLDGVVFHHFTIRKQGLEMLSSLTSQTVSPQKLAEYEAHLVHLDPRMPLVVRTPMGEVMWDHEHLSSAEMDRHPVYAEFLKPQGYRHTMALPLRDDGDTREVLAILRPHDHRPFDLAHDHLIQQLLPDLHRVARLRARLERFTEAQTLAHSAWEAMRALPQAVMLVDGQCRLHYVNPAAERFLPRDPPAAAPEEDPALSGAPPPEAALMRSHQGKLQCSSPVAQEMLERLVSTACNDALTLPLQARVGSFLLSPLAPKQTERTVVNVLPMPPEEGGNGLSPSPRLALVMITSSRGQDGGPRMDAQALGAALRLTPAETRLAMLLAQGRDLRDFSAQESISWHTARTHVRNLMRKTHVHRQVDLVQLLRNMLIT